MGINKLTQVVMFVIGFTYSQIFFVFSISIFLTCGNNIPTSQVSLWSIYKCIIYFLNNYVTVGIKTLIIARCSSVVGRLGGARRRYKIRTAARNPTDSKLILIVDRLTSGLIPSTPTATANMGKENRQNFNDFQIGYLKDRLYLTNT